MAPRLKNNMCFTNHSNIAVTDQELDILACRGESLAKLLNIYFLLHPANLVTLLLQLTIETAEVALAGVEKSKWTRGGGSGRGTRTRAR